LFWILSGYGGGVFLRGFLRNAGAKRGVVMVNLWWNAWWMSGKKCPIFDDEK